MKLAITTFNYFGVFDTETEDLKILHENEGKYFGITWDESSLYATVGVRLNFGEQYGEKTEYILEFDKQFKFKGNYLNQDFGLNNVHQLFYKDGAIWVANSGQNRIDKIWQKNKKIKKWYPHFFKRGKDINHFNSIFFKNEHLYLLAHNNNKPSKVYVYNYPRKKKIKEVTLGLQAHNIFVEDNGEIFVCDSKGTSNVISNNGNCYEVGTGYVRGLAVSTEYLIVGSSNKAERRDRQNGNCNVYFFNRRTKKLKDVKALPNAGNIYDIRILDEPDYAHHKIVFPGNFNS